MLNKLYAAASLLGITAFAGSAVSQIKVEYDNGSGSGFSDVTLMGSYVSFPSGNSSGAELTLIDQGSAGKFRVTTLNKTTQDIGVITYNGTSEIKLLVMDNGDVGVAQGVPAARNWEGLAGSGVGNVYLQTRLNGYLTGDVTVGKFLRIDADDGIDSGITIRQLNFAQSITVRSSTGGIGADIVLEEGDLDRVEAQGDFTGSLTIENGDLNEIFRIIGNNDLLGDIYVSGTINKIWVQGDIGSFTTPVSIYSDKDTSSATGTDLFSIWYVLCRGDMYADITVSNSASNRGRFKRIRANEGVDEAGKIASGQSDVPRDFAGSIRTYDAIEIDSSQTVPCIMFDDVLGESEIFFYDMPYSPITIDTLSADSRIVFGDKLLPVTNPVGDGTSTPEDSMIFLSNSSGLYGQVIVNQNNLSGNKWTGEFGIGGSLGSPAIEIKLSGGDDIAPYYETLPATLGGGAIGHAPFNFHAKASVPEADTGQALSSTQYDTYEVVIEHYGPVFEGNTADGVAPVTIWYYADGLIASENVTIRYNISVGATEATADRTISITPASPFEWEDGLYRIEPNDLVCAYVKDSMGENIPVVYSYTSGIDSSLDNNYVFMISAAKGCGAIGADVNGDGFLTPGDFTAWIAAYNNTDPECDQNNDGNCTQTDFTAWIANYNMGCM